MFSALALLMLQSLIRLNWKHAFCSLWGHEDQRSSIHALFYHTAVALSGFVFFPSLHPLNIFGLHACWNLMCRIIITVRFLWQRHEAPWKNFYRRLWRAAWLNEQLSEVILVRSIIGCGTAWKQQLTPLVVESGYQTSPQQNLSASRFLSFGSKPNSYYPALSISVEATG